eukprot:TRINITY_DN7853_c0_g1_i1.p2 TRINITY_DN7853_c0_g1~~TRINITY_DN7853_c0_g1_i1.p2  ORF type:complete len:388 (+),score=130.28 TRINITY_DN7853_c0_g1_i1:151-1314(+)
MAGRANMRSLKQPGNGFNNQAKKTLVFQTKKRLPGPVQLPSMRAAAGEPPRDSLADRVKEADPTGAWRGHTSPRSPPPEEAVRPGAANGSALPSTTNWASIRGRQGAATQRAADDEDQEDQGQPAADSPEAAAAPAAGAVIGRDTQWADVEGEMDFRDPLPLADLQGKFPPDSPERGARLPLRGAAGGAAEEEEESSDGGRRGGGAGGAIARDQIAEVFRRRTEQEEAEERERKRRLEEKLATLNAAAQREQARKAELEAEEARRRAEKRRVVDTERAQRANAEADRQLHRQMRQEFLKIQGKQRREAVDIIKKQHARAQGKDLDRRPIAPQRVIATAAPSKSQGADSPVRDREAGRRDRGPAREGGRADRKPYSSGGGERRSKIQL